MLFLYHILRLVGSPGDKGPEGPYYVFCHLDIIFQSSSDCPYIWYLSMSLSTVRCHWLSLMEPYLLVYLLTLGK